MKRTVTFEIDGEYIERLINVSVEMGGVPPLTTEAFIEDSLSTCVERAVISYVRGLERELEYERRRMENYDDSDVPF